MTSEDIAASIKSRLAALNAEIQRLSDARDALIKTPGNATTAPRERTTQTPSRRRRTRRGGAFSGETLVQLLAANGGGTTAFLTKATGGDRQNVLSQLRELEGAGKVRRSGQRRSTRWHVTV